MPNQKIWTLNGLYSQGTGAVLDSNTNIPSALICAGVYSDECHIVGGGNDIAASKLNTQRRFASSMLIDPAILWITGKKPNEIIYSLLTPPTERFNKANCFQRCNFTKNPPEKNHVKYYWICAET